jgi:hypothetical protein
MLSGDPKFPKPATLVAESLYLYMYQKYSSYSDPQLVGVVEPFGMTARPLGH